LYSLFIDSSTPFIQHNKQLVKANNCNDSPWQGSKYHKINISYVLIHVT